MLRLDPTRALRALIADAIGVATVSALAACGGKVVVDPGLGAGGAISEGDTTNNGTGATSTAASTGATATTSSGSGWLCDKTATGTAIYACINVDATCPPIGSPELGHALATAAAVCWDDSCVCCGQPSTTTILCGPDTTQPMGICCYYLDVLPSGCCVGRPFTVDGIARTAPLQRRADWARRMSPATAGVDMRTRIALGHAWEDDARYEHASIASFARLALELVAVGAPPELLRDAQRALGDEIAHAGLAFGLASAYAGRAMGPASLDVTGATPATRLVDLAVAAVREGCVGETVAALVAAEALRVAHDPAVVAALEVIARDEAEHAAFAFRVVAWAIRIGDDEVRRAVARAFEEPFELPGGVAPDIDVEAFHAHGRLTSSELHAVAKRAIEEIVRPSAHALLAS